MQQFQLAVATRCFDQPLTASIKTAAGMKVQGLQLELRNEVHSHDLSESGRRELMHRIDEYGLKVASSTFPLKHPIYELSKIDSRIAAIRKAMKFAYGVKSKTLCIRIGNIPTDADSKERKTLVEVLSDLAGYGAHVGTILAIAQSSDSTAVLTSLLEEIKTGPLGVDFDPAHFAMTGRPVIESLKSLHNHVKHVQLRDGTTGVEGGEECVVGKGNVDWIEVLALLGEVGYRGWLTAIRNDGDDQIHDISQGIKFIHKLMLGG